MDLSELPEGIGLFISEMINDWLVVSFLSGMLGIFIIALARCLYLAIKYPARFRNMEQEIAKTIAATKDSNAITVEIVKSLREGTLKKSLLELGLASEQRRFSAAMILVEQRKYETDYRAIRDILNPQILVSRILPRSLFQTAPLLLTLGVIGTFLGLIIGVSGAGAGLASPDVAEARAAMAGLLDGAKLAFVTSLAGLVLATLTGMAARATRNRLVAAIEALATRVYEALGSDDWEKETRVAVYNTQIHTRKIAEAAAQTQEAITELVKVQNASFTALTYYDQKLAALVATMQQLEATLEALCDRIDQQVADTDNTAEDAQRAVKEPANG